MSRHNVHKSNLHLGAEDIVWKYGAAWLVANLGGLRNSYKPGQNEIAGVFDQLHISQPTLSRCFVTKHQFLQHYNSLISPVLVDTTYRYSMIVLNFRMADNG